MDQIRRAALELFRERGFHATSMVDIGARLRISGPALYRHFANKEQILRSAIEDQLDETTAETRQIMREAASPLEALERLIAAGVHRVLEYPELAVAAMRDQPLLSHETRLFIGRAERHIIEDWVHVVAQLRPELSDREARTIVQGVIGLPQWMVQYDGGLPREQLERRMQLMMLGAVLHDAPRSTR